MDKKPVLKRKRVNQTLQTEISQDSDLGFQFGPVGGAITKQLVKEGEKIIMERTGNSSVKKS